MIKILFRKTLLIAKTIRSVIISLSKSCTILLLPPCNYWQVFKLASRTVRPKFFTTASRFLTYWKPAIWRLVIKTARSWMNIRCTCKCFVYSGENSFNALWVGDDALEVDAIDRAVEEGAGGQPSRVPVGGVQHRDQDHGRQFKHCPAKFTTTRPDQSVESSVKIFYEVKYIISYW